mgnify:FL=1
MFLKLSDDFGGETAQLETLLKSASDITKFLDYLRDRFKLKPEAPISDIAAAIEKLFSDLQAMIEKFQELSEDTRYSQDTYNKLLAELVEKELLANIANYSLFEFLGVLTQLVNSRKEFANAADYLNYSMLVLNKVIITDVVKGKDVLSKNLDDIARLESALSSKIEDFEYLRLRMAEMFSGACIPDLSTFDRDFDKFTKEYETTKRKADKYAFLLSKGAVKEVGDTMSATGSFHLTYGK